MHSWFILSAGPRHKKVKHILSANVNAFTKTWQVRDSDPRLFNTNRDPQYPSKCVYDIKKMVSSHHNRNPKELRTVPMVDATTAYAIYCPGPL